MSKSSENKIKKPFEKIMQLGKQLSLFFFFWRQLSFQREHVPIQWQEYGRFLCKTTAAAVSRYAEYFPWKKKYNLFLKEQF